MERVITQQIAGIHSGQSRLLNLARRVRLTRLPFFQGEPQTMRFVSTYSLNEASRGYPRILEYQVIPGENGEGVRLIVNELWYTGPLSAGSSCVGMMPDPLPVSPRDDLPAGCRSDPASFVLADKLAQLPVLLSKKSRTASATGYLGPSDGCSRRVPNAIRIEMTSLEHRPGRLEVPVIVAPVRITRESRWWSTQDYQP